MAEWLDLLAPVVLNAHAERDWLETLALDNTWFMVENRRTHRQTLAFHVLGLTPTAAAAARTVPPRSSAQGRLGGDRS